MSPKFWPGNEYARRLGFDGWGRSPAESEGDGGAEDGQSGGDGQSRAIAARYRVGIGKVAVGIEHGSDDGGADHGSELLQGVEGAGGLAKQ